MPTRKTPFVEGEYYHIYNRGNNKQKIFFDEEDREKFTKYLYLCNTHQSFKFRDDVIANKINAFNLDVGDQIVSIGAWVLMPNHFHLYLTIPHTPGVWGKENPISKFVRKLSTSYVKHLNEKYNRTGSLFEGPFKSTHVENDNHARYLFSYIHLNPIKLIQPDWKEKGIRNINKHLNFLENYKWSSYHDYKQKKRPENKIIFPNDFLVDFRKVGDFNKEILEWLEYGKET